MKPSILTLKDLSFLRVYIESDGTFKGRASEFDFDGANLGWNIRHGKHTEQATVWWVGVTFALKSEDEKPSPYNLDIQAVGLFDIDDRIAEDKREPIIYENGAALVFGAIREMVSTITARSMAGPLMLPTATFIGSFKEHQEKLAANADSTTSTPQPQAE